MRFMIIVKATKNSEAGVLPSEKLLAEMTKYNEELTKAGVLLDMGGQPFEGLGYLGYDNIRGEYTAVWLDNMNTGITRASGQFDPVTKKYAERGTFSCPMTGEKDMPFRGEWNVIDNDTLSYTMYNPGPDGKEMKGMEISYNRVK